MTDQYKKEILKRVRDHNCLEVYSWEELESFVRLKFRRALKEYRARTPHGYHNSSTAKVVADTVTRELDLDGKISIEFRRTATTNYDPGSGVGDLDVARVVPTMRAEIRMPAGIVTGSDYSSGGSGPIVGTVVGFTSPADYRMPWGEVKKMQEWVDSESGYACFMRLDPTTKVLCAYVLLPPEHPWAAVYGNYFRRPHVERMIERDITFMQTPVEDLKHNMKGYPGLFAVGFDGAQAARRDYAPGDPAHGSYEQARERGYTWRNERFMKDRVAVLAKIAKEEHLKQVTAVTNEKFKSLYPKPGVRGDDDRELDAKGMTLLIRTVAAREVDDILAHALSEAVTNSQFRDLDSRIIPIIRRAALKRAHSQAEAFRAHGETLSKSWSSDAD